MFIVVLVTLIYTFLSHPNLAIRTIVELSAGLTPPATTPSILRHVISAVGLTQLVLGCEIEPKTPRMTGTQVTTLDPGGGGDGG